MPRLAAYAMCLGALFVRNPPIKEPGLVIVCRHGGVSSMTHEGAVAFGNDCLLLDKQHGRAIGSLSVYDDSQAVP